MRHILVIIFLVSSLLAPICGSKAQAEEGLFSLTKDINYDITVQLSQGIISKIKNIRVFGTVEIAGKIFLVAELQNDAKAANSLIVLDSIKTIVPSNTLHETLISDNSLK